MIPLLQAVSRRNGHNDEDTHSKGFRGVTHAAVRAVCFSCRLGHSIGNEESAGSGKKGPFCMVHAVREAGANISPSSPRLKFLC
eukprot:1154519-Pelagomonas_calceolata.AAC.7